MFKDKTALTPKHLLEEDEVVDREKEIDIIADYIRGVLAGSSFKVLLIYGPSGSGKTALTRYVLRKLQEESIEQALPIYIDCFSTNTRHSTLSELMRFSKPFYDGKAEHQAKS